MINHGVDARQLLEQCEALEHGAAQVAVAQEAVRQADLSGDRDLRIEARRALISAATFAGRAELSLTAFAWNIAHYTLEELTTDDVWYEFQWLVEDAALMVAASRANFDHILSEMDRVYELANWMPYPVDLARFRSAEVFGATRSELQCLFEVLVKSATPYAARSSYVTHVLATAHFTMGRFERGLQIIGANFKREDGGESEYPARCHAMAVLPFMAHGGEIEADHHFRIGCRMSATNPVFLRSIAPLITHAAAIGDVVRVVELFERHLPWALSNFDRWSAMHFYLCASQALTRCAPPQLTLRLPQEFEGWDADGSYDRSELVELLWSHGVALAALFDARHGNTAWTDRAAALRESGDALRLLYPS